MAAWSVVVELEWDLPLKQQLKEHTSADEALVRTFQADTLAFGAASTAAQSMAGAASEALSFQFFGFTVVGLSERNNARHLGRRAAKNHHHRSPFRGVVADKAALGSG